MFVVLLKKRPRDPSKDATYGEAMQTNKGELGEVSANKFLLGFVVSVQGRWIEYDRLTRACISPGISALHHTSARKDQIQRACSATVPINPHAIVPV
jgi:hypothetical protein